MPNILRIIDANLNRAREALRVMEEAARFILNDACLTEALKTLRHDLAAVLKTIDALDANRDVRADVGTGIELESESQRCGAADVAVAAGKRLSEALRAMEEYAKTLPVPARQAAGRIESLRYRGYELDQRLVRGLGAGRAQQWQLCVLISAALCPKGDWFKVATVAVEAGAPCVQLREKQIEARDFVERARRLVSLCRPRGVTVIVNDRPDVAILAEADGVHLGQSDVPCKEARRLVGRQLLIGVSTSCLEEAHRAVADGADYCGVGPMFNSMTKHKEVIVGETYLKVFAEAFAHVPHLAIGGIGPHNVSKLVAAGAQGVAVSSAICSAADPGSVVKRILEAWT
jgi:thiamine-phosphate pyrophosphorylase